MVGPIRWAMSKKRSSAQKNRFRELQNSRKNKCDRGDRENLAILSPLKAAKSSFPHENISNNYITLDDQLLASQLRNKDLQCRIWNERKCTTRAKATLTSLHANLDDCQHDLELYQTNCQTLATNLNVVTTELQHAQATLLMKDVLIGQMRKKYTKMKDRLTVQISRAEKKVENNFMPRRVPLKEKGIITQASRTMTCDLVSLFGVPTEHVPAVIQTVGATLGITVTDQFTDWSVRRIDHKTVIKTKLQLVSEIEGSNGQRKI